MTEPLLSVITVTRGRRELLLRKLRSLEEQSLPAADFEWVVCDDAGDDGSADALREQNSPLRLTVLSQSESLGPGPGRNACVAASSGSLLYFSDDDCLLPPDALERHLQEQRRPAVAVGGVRWEADGRHEYMRPARVRYWNLHGMNTSLPRQLFDRAGGFDPRIEGYGLEDVLLGYRLWRLGAEFRALPGVVVRHLGANPMRAPDLVKALSAGRNAVRIVESYPQLAFRLGVHPLSLGLKRLLLRSPLRLAWRAIDEPSYRYERAYLEAALEELRGRPRLEPRRSP